MSEETYLSVEEVAKKFGINSTTVYRLAQRGALPGFKIGNQWRFSQKSLDLWISGQMNGNGKRIGGNGSGAFQ